MPSDRPKPAVPPSTTPSPGLPLAIALDRSDALTGLLQRVAQSRNRLAAIADLLPDGLREAVRAGPLDDARWVMLVPDSAAASKLRQLLPMFEARLAAAGLGGPAIRIKVLPRG